MQPWLIDDRTFAGIRVGIKSKAEMSKFAATFMVFMFDKGPGSHRPGRLCHSKDAASQFGHILVFIKLWCQRKLPFFPPFFQVEKAKTQQKGCFFLSLHYTVLQKDLGVWLVKWTVSWWWRSWRWELVMTWGNAQNRVSASGKSSKLHIFLTCTCKSKMWECTFSLIKSGYSLFESLMHLLQEHFSSS